VRNPHLLDTRSKTRVGARKETLRLHKLNKPIRQPVKDDLPDISSHSEDEGEWSSNIGSDDFEEGSSQGSGGEELSEDSDVEMPYETAPRPRRPSWDEDSEQRGATFTHQTFGRASQERRREASQELARNPQKRVTMRRLPESLPRNLVRTLRWAVALVDVRLWTWSPPNLARSGYMLRRSK
jgi:hypothetical protein